MQKRHFLQINQSTDDVYGEDDNATINLTGVTVQMGGSGADNYGAGFRFNLVDVPAGAIIDRAVLRLKSTATVNSVLLKVYGVDADNTNTFANSAGNRVYGRTQTTAAVDWDDDWVDAEWMESPDIKTIVQEIVDRPAWTRFSSLTLLVLDDGSTALAQAESFDGDTLSAAILEITYSYGESIEEFRREDSRSRVAEDRLLSLQAMGFTIGAIVEGSESMSPGEEAFWKVTISNSKGRPLFALVEATMYEGSVAFGNEIPHGSNVDSDDWKIDRQGFDLDGSDGANLIYRVYARNETAGALTNIIRVRSRFLVDDNT